MRLARIKSPEKSSVYHCISKVINSEFLFQDKEKEVMKNMLFKVARFCGVEIITYALMTNHFHILVRVPEHSKALTLTNTELLDRVEHFYGRDSEQYEVVKNRLFPKIKLPRALKNANAQDSKEVAIAAILRREQRHERQRLLDLIYDLSNFMKLFKQRFTVWYNHQHDRHGPIWTERFKSGLFEQIPEALLVAAAYIDLNPVKAGLVKDPKDYRYCGYHDAVLNKNNMRETLSTIYNTSSSAINSVTTSSSKNSTSSINSITTSSTTKTIANSTTPKTSTSTSASFTNTTTDNWKKISANYRTYLYTVGVAPKHTTRTTTATASNRTASNITANNRITNTTTAASNNNISHTPVTNHTSTSSRTSHHITPTAANKVINEQKGKIPLSEMLLLEITNISDGLIIGTNNFVKETAQRLSLIKPYPSKYNKRKLHPFLQSTALQPSAQQSTPQQPIHQTAPQTPQHISTNNTLFSLKSFR